MAKAKAAKNHKFVLVEADNWAGLYVDGKLVEQHHDIDFTEWLPKYGVNLKLKYAYNDLQVAESGQLPENLEDVEFDKEQ